ncbi:hypothetical protein [Algoriphagus boritolerans]|uniref:hypothetical protein n=1 Tax=Algoriphagus boritolerans TaxID=308111 RepID=UPI002FCE56B0
MIVLREILKGSFCRNPLSQVAEVGVIDSKAISALVGICTYQSLVLVGFSGNVFSLPNCSK